MKRTVYRLCRVSGDVLREALADVIPATNKRDGRPLFAAVALSRMGGREYVVATDSYRMIAHELVAATIRSKDDAHPKDLALHVDDAKALAKLLRGQVEPFDVEHDPNTIPSSLRFASVIEGGPEWRYAPLDVVHPTWAKYVFDLPEPGCRIAFHLGELAGALKEAKKDRSELMRLDANRDTMILRWRPVTSEGLGAEETRVIHSAVFFPGTERETVRHFNPQYLLSILGSTDMVEIPDRAKMSPIAVRMPGRVALVMPIRQAPTESLEFRPVGIKGGEEPGEDAQAAGQS
jgi:hypothetical protein